MGGSPTRRYFRRWSADEDAAQLLQPENQWSTPWGGAHQGPCDKCRRARVVEYHCCSCLERGADYTCPVCAGLVEFVDVCPACEGDGTMGRTRRRGVSVFPTIEGLYRFVAEQDADGDDCIIELEGAVSGDRDPDADAGAMLILPTRIVATHPFERGRLAAVRTAIGV